MDRKHHAAHAGAYQAQEEDQGFVINHWAPSALTSRQNKSKHISRLWPAEVEERALQLEAWEALYEGEPQAYRLLRAEAECKCWETLSQSIKVGTPPIGCWLSCLPCVWHLRPLRLGGQQCALGSTHSRPTPRCHAVTAWPCLILRLPPRYTAGDPGGC